ncbi:hypothetical protein JZ751_009682, partial [Albula glossodonta]
MGVSQRTKTTTLCLTPGRLLFVILCQVQAITAMELHRGVRQQVKQPQQDFRPCSLPAPPGPKSKPSLVPASLPAAKSQGAAGQEMPFGSIESEFPDPQFSKKKERKKKKKKWYHPLLFLQ